MVRYRGRGHLQLLSRYCLDYLPNGQPCGQKNSRLINDYQAAHYVDFIPEGNVVKSGESHSVSNQPRASTLELLENRLKTVQEDQNHILNKRMTFSNRQVTFSGKLSFIYA